MTNKNKSIISKGWLIIGIVIILTGVYQIIIKSSLNTYNNISMIELFFTASSLIIIIIGIIMTIEWIRFSKFLKKYTKE
jgi:hypothetical protein